MPRFTCLALTALLALTASCATLSRGDIKRQTESQNTTLDAVRAGSDTADRAARTQSESTAAIIEATGRARAEETRAAAELAREQQKLEEIRARNAERDQRAQELRAQIEQAEREESEADREFARLQQKARAIQKLQDSVEARWGNCFTDVVLIEPPDDHGNAWVSAGETMELAETGKIYILAQPQWDFGNIDRKSVQLLKFPRSSEVTVCPKKNMISVVGLSKVKELDLKGDASRYFLRFRLLDR